MMGIPQEVAINKKPQMQMTETHVAEPRTTELLREMDRQVPIEL